MSNFLEKMQSRYTVKKYNAKGEISREDIETLKDILRLSPSSINSQPWKFTFITNPEFKNNFVNISAHNSEKVENCNVLVVFQVLKNVSDFETQLNQHLAEGSINYYNTYLKLQDEAITKKWMEHQVYLSLGIFLGACAEMGIDTTAMEGIDPQKYDLVLKDDKYETLFAVAVGVRDEEDFNQPHLNPKFRLPKEMIINEI